MRLALAGLLSAAAWAQTARIEGRVVSTEGEPIPRATVTLERHSVAADDSGRFVIDGIAPGRYRYLRVERPGYVRTEYGRGSGAAPVVLEAGQVWSDLVIAMARQAVITGRVTNSAGDPVQGVRAGAMRWVYFAENGGARSLQAAGSVGTTDEKGEYRISGLPAGRYYVIASDNAGLQNPSADATVTPVLSFHGGAITPDDAEALDVREGTEIQGIDIRLQSAPVYRLRGRVVDAVGLPIPGVQVQITPSSDTLVRDPLSFTRGRPGAMARPEGTFESPGLRPGTYYLFVGPDLNRPPADLAPDAPPPVGGAVATIVDADAGGVVIRVDRAGRIRGTITFEGSRPASSSSRVIINVNGGDRGAGGQSGITTKPDFSFTWDVLAPLKYSLWISNLPAGYYVKSILLGDEVVPEGPVDLTRGIPGPMNIVISDKAGSVVGVVKNRAGQVLAGMAVTIWSEDSVAGHIGEIVSLTSDQNGSFEFPRLAPGEYHLAAWEEIDSGLAYYLDFVKLFAETAQVLRVEEGSHHALEIQPVSADRIRAAEAALK